VAPSGVAAFLGALPMDLQVVVGGALPMDLQVVVGGALPMELPVMALCSCNGQ